MKKFLFITLLVAISLLARGQESSCELKGTITSAGGEAITGATITLQSDTTATTLTGAVSNAQGAYALQLLACGTYLLEVRCIGYKTK